RWTTRWLPARALLLLGSRRELALILSLLLLLDPRLNLALGLSNGSQARLASLQLLRDRHAIGKVRGIGPFGQLQQLLYFSPELLLQLLGMAVGQRAVSVRIGVDLGPVQGHRAQLEHPHRARQLQHLHKQLLDLRQ